MISLLSLSAIEEKKLRIAKAVSLISQAPILSIPAFTLINYFSLDPRDFIIITSICILFSAILPISIVIIWSRKHKTENDIPKREDRNYPLIVAITCYLIGALILFSLGAPLLSSMLMFCYFSNTFIVFIINLFWKISIHSMGVAGPTTALMFAFGSMGSLLGFILPVVMWSRYYLKRHTISQLIAGALMGFVLTAGQIEFAYNYIWHVDSDIISILWLIFAFMGPAIVLSTAGILNEMGIRDGYTRKRFHFIGFFSIAIFFRYTTLDISIIFIMLGVTYIGVACFGGNGFLWFDGIRRRSDAPNELLYVIMPMISTIIGLGTSGMLFGRSFMEAGILCVAIGDAIAEPIGVKFGKHKYHVCSLTGKSSLRSYEGSLAVLLACSVILFSFTNNWVISLVLGAVLSMIEAISPRGTDNFTVLVVASMGLAMLRI